LRPRTCSLTPRQAAQMGAIVNRWPPLPAAVHELSIRGVLSEELCSVLPLDVEWGPVVRVSDLAQHCSAMALLYCARDLIERGQVRCTFHHLLRTGLCVRV
jgi:hypothetical protein